MPNVTISLDEDVLRTCREYARKQGMSLNSLIRQLLEQRVQRRKATWIEACFERMDAARIDSGGRSWRREDLYDV
jgi:hypothetical protein